MRLKHLTSARIVPVQTWECTMSGGFTNTGHKCIQFRCCMQFKCLLQPAKLGHVSEWIPYQAAWFWLESAQYTNRHVQHHSGLIYKGMISSPSGLGSTHQPWHGNFARNHQFSHICENRRFEYVEYIYSTYMSSRILSEMRVNSDVTQTRHTSFRNLWQMLVGWISGRLPQNLDLCWRLVLKSGRVFLGVS